MITNRKILTYFPQPIVRYKVENYKTFNKEFCNEIFNKPNTVDDFFRDMKI